MAAYYESGSTAFNSAELSQCSSLAPAVLDALSWEVIDLRSVWNALTSGECRVFNTFSSQERFYLVLGDHESLGLPKPYLNSRNVRILERVLVGPGQKTVAAEFNLSPSTITAAAKQCLSAMGLSSCPSRVPLLIVMAAMAASREPGTVQARTTALRIRDIPYRVISAALPGPLLPGSLSRAELDVIRLLIEGKTHSQIARSRKRSVRTVANQLASGFQRFGVSGRSELLSFLVTAAERTFRAVEHPTPSQAE